MSESKLPAAPSGPPPHFHILNEIAAAKVLGVSSRTLQQLRLDGRGPSFVQLTDRRIGYTMAALESFAAARTRRSTSDAGKMT